VHSGMKLMTRSGFSNWSSTYEIIREPC
jgi:hypothetical protein